MRAAVLALFLAFALSAVSRAEERPVRQVYREGPFEVLRCDTRGRIAERYTGFTEITDLALYDDRTFLVAEEHRGRVTAVDLDGRIVWRLHLEAARYVSVVAPGRILVCQSHLSRLVEVTPEGEVLWQLDGRFSFPAGAVRLPSGNTAVVEGRQPFAVHIVDPQGKTLWKGAQHLANPRALTRLPNGDLVTSGFDTQHAVVFTPYTDRMRTVDHCPHSESVKTTAQGDLLVVSPDHQAVRLWLEGLHRAWEFRTLYPPRHAVMSPGGDILLSIHRLPDKVYLNARRAREIAKRPLSPLWKHLAWGAALAMLLVAALQRWRLVDLALGLGPRGEGGREAPHGDAPGLSPARRIELALYLAGFIGAFFVAAIYLQRIQLHPKAAQIRAYLPPAGAAGVFLALMAWRAPRAASPLGEALRAMAPMARPERRMIILWGLGLACAGLAAWEVAHAARPWAHGLWVASILLLAGGSIERPAAAQPISPLALAGFLAVCLPLVALRFYRLDAYPPNLHHDMALWSMQAFRLIDGDAPTLFTNGWAQIPMPGYLWPALWASLFGRALGQVRIASAVAGLVALGAVYLLARRTHGRSVALTAVGLLGVNHAFVHYSRIVAYIDPAAFQALAAAALVGGIVSGRYAWFALCGAACGYATLSYHAGRLTPVVMAVMAVVFLARHPRRFARRLPGLALAGAVALTVVAPQGMVYYSAKASAMGRHDQFRWLVGAESFGETLRKGVPACLGMFHFTRDRATQYGDSRPGMLPWGATLLGAAIVAAMARAGEMRNAWLLAWLALVVTIGGILTADPPFWPRILAAWAPAAILAASAVQIVYRAARSVHRRAGPPLVAAGAALLVGASAWGHLSFYRNFCRGIPAGAESPRYAMQWSQGIVGRDLRRWGDDALVYVIARQGGHHGAGNAVVQFHGWGVDMIDTREIAPHLPFREPRTVACYFLPDLAAQAAQVLDAHPRATSSTLENNLGQTVATRVVVPPTAPEPLTKPARSGRN